MLFGCGAFVVASIGGYVLAVWPFFLFQEAHFFQTILTCAAAGFLPAIALGVFTSRKFGLPGATGSVAGALATTIFLYLRIQQVFVLAQARQSVTPDYPQSLEILLPAAYLLIVASIVFAVLPKGELLDSDGLGASEGKSP
jgi:hypothetical protein